MELRPADDDDDWRPQQSLLPAPPSETPGVPRLAHFEDMRAQFEQSYREKCARGEPTVAEVWIAVLRGGQSRTAQGVAAWERWAIAHYCDGITHVELVMRDSQGQVVAWTVDKRNAARDPDSGVVRLRQHNQMQMYPPPWWQCKQVASLTPAERMGLVYYLWRQAGKPMDEWGMKKNFVPLIGAWLVGEPLDEEPAYFCSQLVASAFRWIRPAQFHDVNPRRCTPAQLDTLLSNHADMFLSGSIFPVQRFEL